MTPPRPAAAPADADWTVIVPVKHPSRAKTRLRTTGVGRPVLARAIAADTVAAVLACGDVGDVVIVTDDVELHDGLPAAVRIVRDPACGLNGAIAAGAAVAGDGYRAALLGDLPALRPEDLADALRRAREVGLGLVADAEGTGSTLITAAPGLPLEPAFGDGSFTAHRMLGYTALDVPASSSLRRDVDTLDQLRAAVELGLGRHTAALL